MEILNLLDQCTELYELLQTKNLQDVMNYLNSEPEAVIL